MHIKLTDHKLISMFNATQMETYFNISVPIIDENPCDFYHEAHYHILLVIIKSH